MSNFLVIAPFGGSATDCTASFRGGCKIAGRLGFHSSTAAIESDWACAAYFPRPGESGSAVVTDPETGDWWLDIGTWFHSQLDAAVDRPYLLKRYREIGPIRLARELEGFFCIVIGDAARKSIVVITDVVGSCHTFVRVNGNTIAVSSSSLLLAGLADFKLDPIGCQEFLHTGVIYEDRTAFEPVRKLGPGSVYRFSADGKRRRERYWDIAELDERRLDGHAAVTALWESLIAAADKLGKRFPNMVSDLTGGYDSRALVAALASSGKGITTTVSGAADSPDVLISKQLAEVAGLTHLVTSDVPLDRDLIQQALWYTDGEYDLFDYARILYIHHRLKERFDISLNGSFGELARGYWWELLFPFAGRRRPLDSGLLARRRFAVSGVDPGVFPPEQRLDLVSHFAGVIERTNAGLERCANTLQMDNAYLMLRMQRWQGRIASSTNRLWPCLSPFLLRTVLETMLTCAPPLRRRGLMIRRMLAECYPRFAAIPLEHGYPAMPATWRNLHRFSPLIGLYARKIRNRLGHRLALTGNGAQPKVSSSHSAAVELMRETLDPATMRLRCMLEPRALQEMASVPAFSPLMRRVYSLERALRSLEAVHVTSETEN